MRSALWQAQRFRKARERSLSAVAVLSGADSAAGAALSRGQAFARSVTDWAAPGAAARDRGWVDRSLSVYICIDLGGWMHGWVDV